MKYLLILPYNLINLSPTIKSITIIHSMAEVSSETNPQLFEFKNALHYGFISTPSSQTQSTSPKPTQKNTHLSSRDSLFNRSTYKMSFSPSKLISTLKESIEGIGLTIDDEGNILLASWTQGKIEGKYFLFKSNIIGDFRMTNQFQGICQYGTMVNGRLHGDNYLYSIDGTIAKSTFQADSIAQKWYLCEKRKNQGTGLTNIQCQVYHLQKKDDHSHLRKKDTKLTTPHFKDINNTKTPNQDPKQKQTTSIIDPLSFLKFIVAENRSENQNQKQIRLSFITLNQHEAFVGFVQMRPKNDIKTHRCLHSDETLNGFGLVLNNSWPYQYGNFSQGTLEGLGRKYQTEINFQDGFFLSGHLLQGYLFDYQNKKIYFGYNSIMQAQNPVKSEFIISQAFDLNHIQVISDYKKSYHLKSLSYTNNYFNASNLLSRSPWPYTIISKLQKTNHVKLILKSYDPESEISSIQKQLQASEEKTERDILQEMNRKQNHFRIEKIGLERKKMNIKNGIQTFLKERQQRSSKETLQINIREYQRMLTVSKKQEQNDHLQSQNALRPQSTRQNLYFMEQTPKKVISQSKPAPSSLPQKKYNLTELVKVYRECEEEKELLKTQKMSKQSLGKKQQNIDTARKSAKNIPMSFRNDQTFKAQGISREHSALKNNRNSVRFLDQIYKQFLKS